MKILKVRVSIAKGLAFLPFAEVSLQYDGECAAFPKADELQTAFFQQFPELASKIPMHDAHHRYGVCVELI